MEIGSKLGEDYSTKGGKYAKVVGVLSKVASVLGTASTVENVILSLFGYPYYEVARVRLLDVIDRGVVSHGEDEDGNEYCSWDSSEVEPQFHFLLDKNLTC
jgi:hypothetical protein